MPRRKQRARRSNPAPFILVALALMAFVIWATVPHRRSAHIRRPVATVTAAASPGESPASTAASPQPSVSGNASPAPSASTAASATGSPAAAPSGTGQLAIIIDDCGQWPEIEKALIGLPIPLTLAVMPHVRYGAETAQMASDAGKGVMLHLPMEPLSHKRSGEGEIETAMTDEQVIAQTRDDLSQVPLAAGVNNHEGSEASADARVMRDVMQVIKEHNLFFVDSRTNKATVAAQTAVDDGVPNASRDVFLDNQANAKYTESMLEHAADVALRKGSAIAIGHPKATTLEAIRDLYPQLQARGVQFVLVSQLVR